MPKRKERSVLEWDRSAWADASLGLGRWLNSGGLGGVGQNHAFPAQTHLGPRRCSFLWATACDLVRKPDAVTPPVRFDERDVETEHGGTNEALPNERGSPG